MVKYVRVRRAALAVATAAAVSALAIGCASSVGSPQVNGQGGNGGNGGGVEFTAVEATGITPPTDPAAGWDLADSCKMVQAVWAAFATNYTHEQPDPSGAFYGLNNDLTNYVGYITGQLSEDVDKLAQQAEALYTADVNGGSASAELTSGLTQTAAAVAKDCGITLSLS
jgi:hypothetical protein